uniref:Uncharacterized protein n=1 Tax=Rhizophora mucronata TaxID=61149 RepID=A0A2P2IJJ1_RHIMU
MFCCKDSTFYLGVETQTSKKSNQKRAESFGHLKRAGMGKFIQ